MFTLQYSRYKKVINQNDLFQMRWQVAGGMGVPLAAAIFCMLPLFTSSNGDIRE